MPQNKITPINIDPLFTTPLNYERMLGNNLSINQPNITPRNQNAIRTAGMFLTNPKAPETATSQIKIPGLPELESETESMPQDDSQSRFLASLLSQGAGMFGAALQGENVMKAGQVFESNRDYQNKLNEQKKQIESLTNPESDVSKRKRLVYERALGIKIPGEFSASDLEDRNVLQGLVAQSQPKPVPGRVGGGVSQPKEVIQKDEKEKKNPFLKEMTDVRYRSKNALDALNQIEDIVRRKVTTELFGSEGKELEQLIQNVAINYNKVLDPGSVVRTEEAENVANSLGIGGFGGTFTSTNTALKQIEAFKNLVINSRNNALNAYTNLPSNFDFSDQEQFIIEEYRKNPSDPEISETYNNMLRSKGLR